MEYSVSKIFIEQTWNKYPDINLVFNSYTRNFEHSIICFAFIFTYLIFAFIDMGEIKNSKNSIANYSDNLCKQTAC